MSIDLDYTIFKEIFERYPFGVLFFKTGPKDINKVDYDSDLAYFYFSPLIVVRSKLNRALTCDGKTTAKKEFPRDHDRIFSDDINILKNYRDGRVLAFVETWNPPAADTFVYARKTTMTDSDGTDYMAGTFEVIDDVTLGVPTKKLIPYSVDTPLPSMGLAPSDDWWEAAFDQCPNGMALVDPSNPSTVSVPNRLFLTYTKAETAVKNIAAAFIAAFPLLANKEELLQNAAWLPYNTDFTHNPCDIGTYGIRSAYGILQVIVVRPSMRAAARAGCNADQEHTTWLDLPGLKDRILN